MTTEHICPICGGEMEDTRHVMVECFYAVKEIAPTAVPVPFLVEVEEGPSYYGTTRRYPAGTKDRFVSTDLPPTVISLDDGSTTDVGNIKVDVVQDPIPGARLLEKTGHSVTCCKQCRADFLTMFGAWSKGRLVGNRGHGDIPIRVNGATRMVTYDEYERMRRDRSDE